MESNLTIDSIKEELQTMINNTTEQTGVLEFLNNLSTFMNDTLEKIKTNNEENELPEVVKEKTGGEEDGDNLNTDSTGGEAALAEGGNAVVGDAAAAEVPVQVKNEQVDVAADAAAEEEADPEAEGEKGNNPENENIEKGSTDNIEGGYYSSKRYSKSSRSSRRYKKRGKKGKTHKLDRSRKYKYRRRST